MLGMQVELEGESPSPNLMEVKGRENNTEMFDFLKPFFVQ